MVADAGRIASLTEEEFCVWMLQNADSTAASLLSAVAGSSTSEDESVFLGTSSLGPAADLTLTVNYGGGVGLQARRLQQEGKEHVSL